MSEEINKPTQRLLMIITDWDKSARISDIFEASLLQFCYLTNAGGTASSEILDMIGLGATDKALALCIAPQPLAHLLLKKADDALLLSRRGTGIGFTVPLSGAAANFIRILNEEIQEKFAVEINKMESEVEKMKIETSMTLILSIINQGYSEDLMEAARSAGATGGTIIHARRLDTDEKTNFLGLPVQSEKEIVFIIAEKDDKAAIMKAINQKCGLESEAHGITISLPVDSAVGI